jgi:hypothetical protein
VGLGTSSGLVPNPALVRGAGGELCRILPSSPVTSVASVLNLPLHWRAGTTSEQGPFMGDKWARNLGVIVDHPSLDASPALTLIDSFVRRDGLEVFSTDQARARHVEVDAERGDNDIVSIRFVRSGDSWELPLFAASSWLQHAEQTAADLGLELGRSSPRSPSRRSLGATASTRSSSTRRCSSAAGGRTPRRRMSAAATATAHRVLTLRDGRLE